MFRQSSQCNSCFTSKNCKKAVQGSFFKFSFPLWNFKVIHYFFLKEDAGKAEKFISESMSRLAVTTSAEEAAAKSDLVVEAIVEKLKIKQKLFTSLDKVFVYILWFKILIIYNGVIFTISNIGCFT